MSHLALVVEDEAPLRTLYDIVLKGLNFEVLHAADGQQAIDILEEQSPQVILLDILLPKVNGAVVLDYLHMTPHLQSTPIIIVSAHAEFSRLSASALFLLKPVRPDDIKRAVTQMLTVSLA